MVSVLAGRVSTVPVLDSSVPDSTHCELDPDFAEIFCCAADAGPDISGGREIAQKQTSLCPWKLWFDIDCLAHQYHLMVKRLF